MLETFALEIFRDGELALVGTLVGLYFAGFILSGIVHFRNKFQIGRGTYFLSLALISVLASFETMIWIYSLDAIAEGVLWILFASSTLLVFAIGWSCALVSAARSRDAFETSAYFFLGTIPLANFVLIFKGSRDVLSQDRIVENGPFAGGAAVIVGLLLFFSANLFDRWIDHKLTGFDMMAEEEDELKSMVMLLQIGSVESALKLMADNSDLPMELEEGFVLKSLEAEGSTLRRTFVVTYDTPVSSAELSPQMIKETCSIDIFQLLVSKGATMEEIYIDPNDREIARVSVDQLACDAIANVD